MIVISANAPVLVNSELTTEAIVNVPVTIEPTTENPTITIRSEYQAPRRNGSKLTKGKRLAYQLDGFAEGRLDREISVTLTGAFKVYELA